MFSTSALPSRTRSIRQPSSKTESRLGGNGLSIDTSRAAAAPAPRVRSAALASPHTSDGNGISPTTRMPTRPRNSRGEPTRPTSSRIAAGGGSENTTASVTRVARAASVKVRPQSMYGSTASTSSIGRPPSSGHNDGLMRPPPRPTPRQPLSGSGEKTISRPPVASVYDKVSARREAGRTSTDSSNSSLQRASSTRQTRASSTSTLSSTLGSPARHTRNQSATFLNSSTTLRPPSLSSSTSTQPSSHPETRRLVDPRLHKPIFNTLQQHYSPAKNLAPKPTTASILAPPTPSRLPTNIAISAGTSRLQAELLQLHLLHRDKDTVIREWRESARRQLGNRFSDVVRRHEDLSREEERQADRANGLALKKWVEEERIGLSFEDRITALDEVTSGLWALSEPGGKYSRVVRRFEKWISDVQEIIDAREKGAVAQDGNVVFVEELERVWRDEVRGLGRKIDNLQHKMGEVGSVEGKSSLAKVVNNCRELVEGMMAELITMKRVEGDVMKAEQEWIRWMIKDTEVEETGVGAGAAWRRL